MTNTNNDNDDVDWGDDDLLPVISQADTQMNVTAQFRYLLEVYLFILSFHLSPKISFLEKATRTHT